MTTLYDEIVSKRKGLERVMARIPGFKGYLERQARREADTMLREHITKMLKEQMQSLIAVEKKMLNSGGLAHATKTAEAKTKFQTFIDRIATAAPGYSGFFAAQKIGPEELEKIYAFDAAMLEYSERFREQIAQLSKQIDDKGDIDATTAMLTALATEANSAFTLRDNALTEIY
jgi:hypothetical protein